MSERNENNAALSETAVEATRRPEPASLNERGVPLEEGRRVEKNWILAELEDIDYKADRNHAEAVLEEARQNLLELTEYRKKEIDQAKSRWSEAEVQRKQLEMDRRRSSRL